jgi:hypothetical protein
MEKIEITRDDAGYSVASEPAPTPRISDKPLNLL